MGRNRLSCMALCAILTLVGCSGPKVQQAQNVPISIFVNPTAPSPPPAPSPSSPSPSPTPGPTRNIRLELRVDPQTISPGASSNIIWDSSDCEVRRATGDWSGTRSPNGTQSVSPSTTQTYGMECLVNGAVVLSRSATLTVVANQQFTVNPTSLTLYLGSCGSSTGQFTFTSGQPITLSTNGNIVSLNNSTPSSGTTVTATAVSAGSTSITGTSGGQSTSVAVNVIACQQQQNLSISPNTLNFQLGGNGCTATGQRFITVNSSQPVSLSVANAGMATVNTFTLPSGSNQVAVNAIGNQGGNTTVTFVSGNQTQTATIFLTACNQQSALLCSGAAAALPPNGPYPKSSSQGFNISAPSGCQWTLASNDTHVVSANPASGSGSGFGSLAFLNSGGGTSGVTITFSAGGTVLATRSYTVP